MNKEKRSGRFTSSNIYKLMKFNKNGEFQALGKTYILEKKIEKKMNVSLDTNACSEASTWGLFLEEWVYNFLGFDYELISQKTMLHPEYDLWAGTPDFIINDENNKKIGIAELKCYQKKNFALYSDCLMQKNIELFKKEFPKEYWQIISNAIINEVEIGEAISYMPYTCDYEKIKEMAYNFEGKDPWKYRFIYEKEIDFLPFLPKGGYYSDICKFRFIIPEEDKKLLTIQVQKAIKTGCFF